MDVRFITSAGVESCDPSQLPDLLTRTDGLVWVDMPTCDKQAEETLTTVFGFHPLAVRDSANRNQVPKIHRYAAVPARRPSFETAHMVARVAFRTGVHLDMGLR